MTLDDLPSAISDRLRTRIYADLLRIESARLEGGKSVDDCIRIAYDSFAQAFHDQTQLTLDYIETAIPAWVFDWVVRHQLWRHPPRRDRLGPHYFVDEGPRFVPIEKNELTVEFGSYMTTESDQKAFLEKLQSRILHWRAEILSPKARTQAKPPGPAKRKNSRFVQIDQTLKLIALARPKTQFEVFEMLDARNIARPAAEPFSTSPSWVKAFEKDPGRARSWLSRRWGKLELLGLARGPK